MLLLLKKYFISVQTFLRPFQVTQLLKGRKIWLELKRGDCVRVQTERVKCIALPVSLSSKIKIWSFHYVVVLGQQRIFTKKHDAHAELLFSLLNLLLFWCCHCHHSFVRSWLTDWLCWHHQHLLQLLHILPVLMLCSRKGLLCSHYTE